MSGQRLWPLQINYTRVIIIRHVSHEMHHHRVGHGFLETMVVILQGLWLFFGTQGTLT